MIALKPRKLSFEEAAAIPVGANTALVILRKANIRKGEKVLVYGASGSVGSYTIQLASYFGTHVTGVCSTANLEMVRSLGADNVIDYTQEDFVKNGPAYDVVFDAVSKLSALKARKALKENGRFVSVMTPTKEDYKDLEFLHQLVENDQLKPVIDRTYSLHEIVDAHKYVDTGRKKGNVVIIVYDKEKKASK